MAPVMFINKGVSSKSLSRSDGLEKSLIFSHVQRPTHSRLRMMASETQAIPDPVGAEDAKPKDEPIFHDEAKSVVRRWRKSSRKPLTNAKSQSPTTRPAKLSPFNAVDIAALDPFYSTAVPIRKYMALVLEFYEGAFFDRVYPSKILADISRKYTLSYAAQDASTLNAILCNTSGALYAHSGDVKHGFYATYFKGQAIHHLKKELAKANGHNLEISTAYAVSLLLWLECLQGDLEAVEAHLQGLDHLLSRITGLESSPLPIMTTILSSSYYCAAMLQIRPILKTPMRINERVLSPGTRKLLKSPGDPKLEQLGSRFFVSSNADLIGRALLAIISEQRSCILFQQLCLAQFLIPTLDDIQIMGITQMKTDYNLLDLPFVADVSTITPIQNAVRLAVYSFAQPIMTVTNQSSAFSHSMSLQLKRALGCADIPLSHGGTCLDLILWLLFIGAYFSYGQAEWSWFASRFAIVVKSLDIQSIDKMQDILTGFYYSELLQTVLKALWQELDISSVASDSECSRGDS